MIYLIKAKVEEKMESQITEENVFDALKSVRDPELPLNVVELGLIYDVSISGDEVFVKMTLTTPGCPMHSTLKRDAEEALRRIPGVKYAKVDIVWEPPWNPDMMSEEARRRLKGG